MARVLLAMRDGRAGFRKLFVIKQLRPDLLEEPEFVAMFLDEARLAALLNHPNVVQTHEIVEDDGECAIAMEYLEGQSLSRLHRRVTREGFPLPLHIYILTEALAGLQHAHNLSDLSGAPLNVVHRDVSPGNVFITYDGQVKLLDFGIAKAHGATTQTRVGGVKGKLQYMAPEQARSEKLDCRADLFSVGILLWEALARRPLVPRGQPSAVMLNDRISGNWTPIAELAPDAPPELIAACEKAMAMDPADRFADAGEFRRALVAWLDSSGATTAREELGGLVARRFQQERAQLAQKIAAKLEEDSPYVSNEPLLSKTSFTHLPGANEVSSSTDSLAAGVAHQPPPRKRSLSMYIGIALVAMLGGILLTFLVTRGGEPKAAAGTGEGRDGERARAQDPTEPKGAGAPDSASIELYVAVHPGVARLELDGTPLSGNPYRGRFPTDDKDHELVISAEGFEAARQTLNFTSDIHLELSLSAAEPGDEVGRSSRRSKSRSKSRSKARAKARAEAAAKAKAEADAEAAAAKAKAEADARKKSNPKAGDVLTRPKDDKSRKIDEENPYQ